MSVRVLLSLHWRLVSRMAESEADTPSTPIEFESKYFEFDGVRLPPFCRGKMEEIANFSLRSSDIWIVTYPKSGKHASASVLAASSHLLAACCSMLRQVQVIARPPSICLRYTNKARLGFICITHPQGFMLRNAQVIEIASQAD